MFKISFVSVPAFSRVEPERISAPVGASMAMSACADLGADTVATERNGQRAHLPGIVQRGAAIGRVSAGGNSHHRVRRAQIARLRIAHRGGAIVLRAFRGVAQRAVAARHDAHHQIRVHAKSGRTFGSVQHAQPTAGARAQVKQPPARLQPRGNALNGPRDLRQGALHGRNRLAVEIVHQPGEFQRR